MGTKSRLPEAPADLGSWREILIYLRTHYPIGLSSDSTDVLFQDQTVPSHLGTLNRVRTMRNDLQDVIQYKRDKIQSTPFGKKLSDSVNLKETQSENVLDKQGISTTSMNLYAENLSSQLNILTDDQLEVEDNLSGYDSISLKSSEPPNLSVLLSDLEPNFKLKS
jgi:hypothetical protein